MMYQETGENWVYCVDTQSRIPKWADEERTEFTPGWTAYEAWLAEGNTSLSPNEDQLVEWRSKQSITRLQARLALIDEGLWEAVMAFAAQADARTQAFFEDAQTWKRQDPTLIAAAPLLGLSAEQLDQLFKLAATL